MSLHDYLSKNYGSSSKNSKKKKSKKLQNDSSSNPEKKAIVITENNVLHQASKHTNIKETSSSSSVGNMWKMVGTNQLVSLEEEKDSASDDFTSKTKANNSDQNTIHRDERGHILTQKQVEMKETENDLREVIKMKKLKLLNEGELQIYIRSTPGANISNINSKQEVIEHEDPMAFSGNKSQKVRTSILGRKIYTSVSPDNRFGIQAGARWDGIDRSNGFEKRWFLKQGELNQRKLEQYRDKDDY